MYFNTSFITPNKFYINIFHRMLIESFVTLVMKTRELDRRAERGDNKGQLKSLGACTRRPASWADLAVRVVRGRNLFIPPLVGAASRSA